MNIVFCRADDYEALYVDGAMFTQGHRIGVENLLDYLVESGKSVDSYECKQVDYAWIEEQGDFPMALKSVVFVD